MPLAGLDEDLACSAVKVVAEKIQKGYSAKYKKDKAGQSDPDEREEMARSTFVKACKASSERCRQHAAAANPAAAAATLVLPLLVLPLTPLTPPLLQAIRTGRR